MLEKAVNEGKFSEMVNRPGYIKTGNQTCVIDTLLYIKKREGHKQIQLGFNEYVHAVNRKGINISVDTEVPVGYEQFNKLLGKENLPIAALLITNNNVEVKLYNSVFNKYYVISDYDKLHTYEAQLKIEENDAINYRIWSSIFVTVLPTDIKTHVREHLYTLVNKILTQNRIIDIEKTRKFINGTIFNKLKTGNIGYLEIEKHWDLNKDI